MRCQDGVGETTCLSQKEECNRMYTLHYDSPLGGILLAADEAGLTGLWFEGAKYFANHTKYFVFCWYFRYQQA